jgi:hypothetical protein
MLNIKSLFTRKASGRVSGFGFSLFWMTIFAIAIIDDREAAEQKRRRDRGGVSPPAGPSP